LRPTGKIFTLTAPTAGSENSFETPKAYIPVEYSLNGVKSTFTYDFQPYSVNVIRLKE